MGGEDGRQVHRAFLGQGDGDSSEPFVEVGNDCAILLASNELCLVSLCTSSNATEY